MMRAPRAKELSRPSVLSGLRRRLAITLLTLGMVTAPAGKGMAEDIRLASMRLGTAWYVFSATLYKLMLDELPDGHRLEVMAKGGGIANPLLIDSGKAQIALANRATAVWAAQGDPMVYQGRQRPHLRALVGGLNTVPFSFIVRASYIERTGNDTMDKILTSNAPVRFVMKPRGSSAPVVADLLFDTYGIDRATILKQGGRILQVASKQIPNIMLNDQADVYVDLAPIGHPTVTEVSIRVPVRFLSIPPRIRSKLVDRGLRETVVPQFWKGQEGPTQTVDVGTVILAHQDLSDDLAYRFTKTICENKTALSKAHKAWRNFDPTTAGTRDAAGIALHPGAARYYEERGWRID